MKTCWILIFFLALVLLFQVPSIFAEDVTFGEKTLDGKQIFWLSNGMVRCSVTIGSGQLDNDAVSALPEWLGKLGASPVVVETDGDFALDIMWTGWSAPGKENNAENPVVFAKKDFQFLEQKVRDLSGGAKELDLLFKGLNTRFELMITYQLEPGTFFARRKLAVRDPSSRNHFLRWTWPRQGFVFGNVSGVKQGGFGQPAAIRIGEGGAFFGLEYPTSENAVDIKEKGRAKLRCGQEVGEKIGSSWVESEWVVQGLSPDPHVKLWFWKYFDHIRVASLKPYILYNSWYDLRAPVMVKDQARALNEENVLRTIESFRKRMFEKRGLSLDAFVLDDGWDVYRSDWILNKEQFPNGLMPIGKALQTMGTRLGIWLGPIGGYSHRDWRVGWMRDNGYEVIGDQMCVAGQRYHQLLKKRVTDFVRKDSVGYFKWDGIQFSCSEPDHGHLQDIYSRRAVMQAVIDLCQSVRGANKDIFLNVTSGTWLSPWWMKYANTIWMQGSDYGYANVPSISRRDRAITYRDFVLFEDLRKKEFWFPVANLMTHGVIKGHLQMLGGEREPLDKFTDNALLYLARGIAMWELYISPDLLTDDEWDALAASIRWAKDRFPILSATEMVGGDPGELMAYGYVHFKGKRGIVAARNPFIEPQTLGVELAPWLGLDPRATKLVVERVYPTRWISPELKAAGSELEILLQGYEAAVYEIYPLDEAAEPLLAGVIFDAVPKGRAGYALKIYERGEDGRLLNPEKIRAASVGGQKVKPSEVKIQAEKMAEPLSNISVSTSSEGSKLDISFSLLEPAVEAFLAVLLEPSGESIDAEDPAVTIDLDGQPVEGLAENQKGRWAWYTMKVLPGSHVSQFQIAPAQNAKEWTGKASVWLVCTQKPKAIEVSFGLAQKIAKKRPMPPKPWPEGTTRRTIKLGEAKIRVSQ